jgi:integrating conjugative element protein (TIGR03756 family)
MRQARVLLLVLLVTCIETPVFAAEGDTITSAEILAQSTDLGCMAWSPVGICIWMTCVELICEFDFSIKVRHNIPDIAVSAYKNTGQNPWVDVAGFSPPNSLAQDGGSNTEGANTHNEQALRFKNTDAIGSPGNLTFAALAEATALACAPGATPYWPYFLSVLDYNWRDPIVETPLTLFNALKTIHKGTTNFGPLYPRIGFVNQGHDYKSAVVNARRTADIITRTGQPHVYWPAVWGSRAGYWPPGTENNPLWQQLNPKGSSGCTTLPDIDDTFSLIDPYRARVNQSTGYAWHLWRTYRCCERVGDVLIFHSGG